VLGSSEILEAGDILNHRLLDDHSIFKLLYSRLLKNSVNASNATPLHCFVADLGVPTLSLSRG